MIKDLKQLEILGYQIEERVTIASSDRGIDDALNMLKNPNIKTIDDIDINDSFIQDKKQRYLDFLTKQKEELTKGGKWILYTNGGGGWAYLSLGYFVFVPEEEIVKCDVVFLDGKSDTIYLKEISAADVKDFKYINAKGVEFEGEVIKSYSFIFSKIKKEMQNI